MSAVNAIGGPSGAREEKRASAMGAGHWIRGGSDAREDQGWPTSA